MLALELLSSVHCALEMCTVSLLAVESAGWSCYCTTEIIRLFEFSLVVQSGWFEISIIRMILNILRTLVSS